MLIYWMASQAKEHSHGNARQPLLDPDPAGARSRRGRGPVARAHARRALRLESLGDVARRSRGPARADVPALYADGAGVRLGVPAPPVHAEPRQRLVGAAALRQPGILLLLVPPLEPHRALAVEHPLRPSLAQAAHPGGGLSGGVA